MSQLRSTIESLATQFATSVLAALRGASIDELADVAGLRGGRSSQAAPAAPAKRGPGRPRKDATASATPAAAKRPAGLRGRRTQNDISAMVDSIVGVLTKSATGMRSEQIRNALGVQSKEMPRPLGEALSAGRITKTGQKRATMYFASSGGGGASTGGAKRRGRKPGSKNKKKG